LNIQQRVWEAGLNILGTLLSTDPAALDLPDMRAYIDQAMGRWDPQVVSRQQWLAGAQGMFSPQLFSAWFLIVNPDLLQRQQDRLLKVRLAISLSVRA
jgi:hypothetical protein